MMGAHQNASRSGDTALFSGACVGDPAGFRSVQVMDHGEPSRASKPKKEIGHHPAAGGADGLLEVLFKGNGF